MTPTASRASSVLALVFVLAGCGGSVDSGSSTDGGGTDGGGTLDGATTDTGASVDGGTVGRCGGKAGLTCASDMWCFYELGTCHNPDELGTCRKHEALPCPAPSGDEVCGCNGATYKSACEAISSGQSILSSGSCDAPPPPLDECGGSSGKGCASGSYCEFGTGKCPAPGATGICNRKPESCDDIWAPVCGCDGKTHGNECDAHGAGVTIAFPGECTTSSGKVCGGLAGAVCGPTEYCDWGTIPSTCGGDDGTGICKTRPTACIPADGIYCGCDGKTYESPCAASKAGQGVRKNGPC